MSWQNKNLLFLLITQPVIANAAHTHTHERSGKAALQREGTVCSVNTYVIADRQRDYWSSPLFKMTTRVINQCSAFLCGRLSQLVGFRTHIKIASRIVSYRITQRTEGSTSLMSTHTHTRLTALFPGLPR